MAIPDLGEKAVAGEMTGTGLVKIFLAPGGAIVDLPLVVIPGGSVVDNGDGTVTVTLPDP
ncbi:MAG: hypothetical protein K0U84_18440 [Actinomycetia bacterium]|nr:hypothetical protein [Actinomycetes bacterium]